MVDRLSLALARRAPLKINFRRGSHHFVGQFKTLSLFTRVARWHVDKNWSDSWERLKQNRLLILLVSIMEDLFDPVYFTKDLPLTILVNHKKGGAAFPLFSYATLIEIEIPAQWSSIP